ncbi:MAG: ABC transporter ATP-binding protein [Actinobacteria bacterium]|nr:ABC transporter ATP-binding protein [Actinomycetota bacterium]
MALLLPGGGPPAHLPVRELRRRRLTGRLRPAAEPGTAVRSSGRSAQPLLEIEDLNVSFPTPDGVVQAVRGVTLSLDSGSVLGVVGESGSGKSVTMMAVMGLLPKSARITGSVRFRGQEMLGLSNHELRRYRGSQMGMIFQDPMTSLNPVFTVGHQIAEAVRVHEPGIAKSALRERAIEMLTLVGIPKPDKRVDAYPHEFSGGMRQRAMIAMAMANDPALLIADEPTTALDVTIQAQILDVLQTVRQEKNIGIVLITHDLGVIAGMVEDVAVMYAGQVVEQGTVDDVFYESHHPYTRGLLASLPRLDEGGEMQLTPIRGTPPSLIRLPSGCAFHPRCPHAQPLCPATEPELRTVGAVRSRCHYAEELGSAAEPARSLA